MAAVTALPVYAQTSQVWNPDNGNGTYTNPVIYADYSDPDVCRVGDDFYMTSSSFNCLPGLQILHSKDLVNWRLIGTAILDNYPGEEWTQNVQHGNGVWAPAIRYHKGEFYIYYGDPDKGIFMTKTSDPAANWSPLHLVKEGKGLIDSCPFWDEDGKAYLVHGIAGSRAGFKSVLCMAPMSEDGEKLVGPTRIIFDGHEAHPTVEGPKLYKRNGYYYIFAPAGGVATGWQLVLRSKNPYGPFEEKIVMAQGKTKINGPHQGAWVDTPAGEDWFIHFQDLESYGRVVHLQPMTWKNDWPVIGVDTDGDGCGEPVLTFRKPVNGNHPMVNPAESDEFSSDNLGLQWQWHGIPNPLWAYNDVQKGSLRMYSVPVKEEYQNLTDCPNLLLQKFPAEKFTATAKITFSPNPQLKDKGERCGLVIMGMDYAALTVEDTKSGFILSQNECKNALKGKSEIINNSQPLKENTFYLRVKVNEGGICRFYISRNGKKFDEFGNPFTAQPGKWIGAKVGLFINRPIQNNDGGWIDVDWFRITK
ncbi:MAG: glycoside hydrolase 43 family protein [Bacteroidales bacterium]